MTGRRIVVLALATALAGSALTGCGSEGAAPVVTRPTVAPTRPATTEPRLPRPTTTTRAPSTTTIETPGEPTTTSESTSTSSTSVSETSSTVAETTSSVAETTTSVTETSTSVAETSTIVAERTTTAPADPAWVAFDQALSGRLIGGGDFAASVTVAVDGTVVHTGAYGVRVPVLAAAPPPAALPPPVPGETPPPTLVPPPETAAPVTPAEPVDATDRFRIASLSKVITAIVVLQLVEAGQLGLDEPVGGRLALQVGALPVDPAVNNITVRQLLSHTAGFPSYQRAFFNASADSCSTIGRVGLSAPLRNPPGASYTYSNLNYCLLGLLIEQVSGRAYQAVAQDRLLEPLGITGMRLAGTFDVAESEVLHPSYPGRNYMEVLAAAGSWVATPSDMVKIVDSLDLTKPGFHPLSSATIELMRQPAPPPVVYRPDRWYGLGLIVFVDGAWGHIGTIENAHSMVLHRPDGVTWSVLVNGENPWDSDQLRRIFDESIVASGVVL